MKNYTFILPAVALMLLSSCYDGDYTNLDRMVGEMLTEPAAIDETNNLISLRGTSEYSHNLKFQLSREKNFTGETVCINYEDATNMSTLWFGGTYFYRLITAIDGDTLCAPNVETFYVNNYLTDINFKKYGATTYQLSCVSKYMGEIAFLVSIDKDFNEYTVCEATHTGNAGTDSDFVYSGTVRNLVPGTTYYAKAVRYDVCLGPLEGETISFTTDEFLKMGNVTYTDWDGKNYPMQNYDFFIANFLRSGKIVANNIEVYRSGDVWKLSKDIIPGNSGVMYGFHSNLSQDSNNEIQIQTYKYDNSILMWGQGKEDNGTVDMNFRNMLARIVLHITVAEDYPQGKPIIENFTISGKTLPTIAQFIVNEGRFAFNQYSYSEPLGYFYSTNLSKGETVDVVLYSIPCDKGTATVTLNLTNNSKYISEIEIGWNQGNTYEYNMAISNQGLTVSDVKVNQWQPVDGGSITINPK